MRIIVQAALQNALIILMKQKSDFVTKSQGWSLYEIESGTRLIYTLFWEDLDPWMCSSHKILNYQSYNLEWIYRLVQLQVFKTFYQRIKNRCHYWFLVSSIVNKKESIVNKCLFYPTVNHFDNWRCFIRPLASSENVSIGHVYGIVKAVSF